MENPSGIRTYYLKNMISRCCLQLLAEKIGQAGFHIVDIQLGILSVSYREDGPSENELLDIFRTYGFEPITSREKRLVEQIKVAVLELIHYMNNVDSVVRKSDYIVEKLGMSYPYLSHIFSEHEGQTLEKYLILQKIERIKELIIQNEFTLSEIAFMMDYNSVQYLSAQFRKITGMTVSEFRSREIPPRQAVESI